MKILRNIGELKTVVTWRGRRVFRQDKIYVPELNYEVPCASYDNHFIFEDSEEEKGSLYKCSCGGPAVTVGSNAYAGDASPQGAMFICLSHAQTGKHLSGDS